MAERIAPIAVTIVRPPMNPVHGALRIDPDRLSRALLNQHSYFDSKSRLAASVPPGGTSITNCVSLL